MSAAPLARLAGHLERAGVRWAELSYPPGAAPREALAGVHPDERAAVGTVAPRRAADFAAGRHCAHTALAGLGHGGVAVLPGTDRAPVWPAGVTGSITHCAGYAAAVAGCQPQVVSVGIDAEPDAPLPERVETRVLREDERDAVASLHRDHPGVAWDRLGFSAKEAVYKAWYPLTGAWLGFGDVRLEVSPERGGFTAWLTGAAATRVGVAAFPGRFAVDGGVIVTMVLLELSVLDPTAAGDAALGGAW